MIGEYGHQPLGFTKGKTILEYLYEYYLLMKNTATLGLFLGLFNDAFSTAQIKKTEWEDDSEKWIRKQMQGNGQKLL